MALTATRVSVATTATLVIGVITDTTTTIKQAMITNRDSAVSVFLGAANVTTATGVELKAGESIGLMGLAADDDLYGITASGTVRVDVLAQAG